jgi:hypothetical protein
MPKLIGFVHSVELELEFTGQELYYLVDAANKHYDWTCKATAFVAGRDGRNKNGILTIFAMYLDRENYSWNDWKGSLLDYLAFHRDKTVCRALSWRDVDLLTKVAEGFETSRQACNLLSDVTGKQVDSPYDPEQASAIYASLRGSLRAASQHLEHLQEQEEQRRKELVG